MAVYVTSDLHGFLLADLLSFLNRIGFGENDFLYVLGDVIDRNGDGGVGVLRWMTCQINVEFILGNHEKMMLDSAFVFDEITEQSVKALGDKDLESLYLWQANGGDVTLGNLKILRARDPEVFSQILSYCRDAPLYEYVTVNGKKYLLVHSGLGRFSKDKSITDYSVDDLVWTRPYIKDEYYDDVITVFGHTPTRYYGPEYAGRPIITRTWIDIDIGAAYTGSPLILRLDDMKEFCF